MVDFDIMMQMVLALVFCTMTNVAEISAAISYGSIGADFNVRATVISDTQSYSHDFSVKDDTGCVILAPVDEQHYLHVQPGLKIQAQGVLHPGRYGHIAADCTNILIVGKTVCEKIKHATFRQINNGEFDSQVVSTTGTLRDYFTDEIDSEFLYLILTHEHETVYAVCRNLSFPDDRTLDSSIGTKLTITGLCDPRPSGCRRKIGRIIRINDNDPIRELSQQLHDPFNVQTVKSLLHLQPAKLQSYSRMKIAGRVLATWGHASLLIETQSGNVSRIDLAQHHPPTYNSTIEIVGFPETDLYRINFSRALWRTSDRPHISKHDPVSNIIIKTLLSDFRGKTAINADFHGRTVRLRGTVRSLPSIGNDGRFYLESDGYTLPVDISANPVLVKKLEIGSVIDVTGVCVMDIENWRPNLVFPHIKEVMIVTRTPDDIVVVKRPPWWTPARLMIVIGSLLAVLIGILIWNRALKALAEKRGKALANEELERLESDLKVCERTRLAVELHDSIAQNLTGVSMEIDTALRGEEPLPAAAAQHMGRALRTIDSCRGELRNCLWDLRSQALEEDDMNKAIRLTLSQTIGKADLIVRFNVPRSRFTDNTAHTLLRIIRELAANAVRHGHATEIKVAGSIEDNILKFSVRDNGCGFDPDACPGVIDGHFGLQGVRERVASFEGNLRIESALGKGTRVSVSINAPQGNDKEKL